MIIKIIIPRRLSKLINYKVSGSNCESVISQIQGTVSGLVPYSIEYMHIQDLLCSPAIWPRAGRGGPRRRYRGIAGDGLPDIRPVTPLRSRCHPLWRLSAYSLPLFLSLFLSLPSSQLPTSRAYPKFTITLHDGFSPAFHFRFGCDQLGRICWIHLPIIAFPYLSRRHRDDKLELVGIDTVISICYILLHA